MTTENTKLYEGKTCFVITPIGGDSTDIRREADGIIDEVLIPILEEELGFTVEVAHRVDSSGSITQQVIQSVINSDFAICNLATLNPNVMYELALRHAARKPVVTIAPKGTSLPFDISDDRVVFYRNDIAGALQLKADIQPKICSAMEDEAPDNPVYRAIKSGQVMQEVHAEGGANALMLDAINSISKKVDSLRNDPETSLTRVYQNRKRLEKYNENASLTVVKPNDAEFTKDEIRSLNEILNRLKTITDLNMSLAIVENSKYINVELASNKVYLANDFSIAVANKAVASELELRGYLVF